MGSTALSPLEQLGQSVGQGQTQPPSTPSQSQLSPLEQLGQSVNSDVNNSSDDTEIPSTTTGFEASGQMAPKAAVQEGLKNQALGTAATLGLGTGVSAAADVLSPTIATILGMGGTVAEQAEKKLVDTVGDAAEKLGLERPDVDSFHESVANLASQLKQRAQTAYQQLDEQIPGFQELRDKIQQYQQAYKLQAKLDPEKAESIKKTLDTAKQTMSSMLEKGQQDVWDNADRDWQQYRSLQQVLSKTARSAEDLTSDELTNVNKLKSGLQSVQNATRGGNPVDYLKRAFPEHADQINTIVQEASDKLNKIQANKETALHILKWMGLGGAAYEGAKALTGSSGGK